MLLLIVVFGGVQRHGGHRAHRAAHAVIAGGEHGIVKGVAPAGQRLEALALQRHAGAVRRNDRFHIFAPSLANGRQLTASDNGALGIDHADGTVGGLFELEYRVLKNSAGHNVILPQIPRRYFVQSAQSLLLLYRHNHDFASVFSLFHKKLVAFLRLCQKITDHIHGITLISPLRAANGTLRQPRSHPMSAAPWTAASDTAPARRGLPASA